MIYCFFIAYRQTEVQVRQRRYTYWKWLFFHFPMRYPATGEVLKCIDSCSLSPFLLPLNCFHCGITVRTYRLQHWRLISDWTCAWSDWYEHLLFDCWISYPCPSVQSRFSFLFFCEKKDRRYKKLVRRTDRNNYVLFVDLTNSGFFMKL